MDPNDQKLPEWWRRRALRGQVAFYNKRQGVVVQSWPKPRGKPKSPAQAKTQTDFAKLAAAQKAAWAVDRVGAEAIATGTQYMWRDVLGRALVGRLIELVAINPEDFDVANIQQLLDQISDQTGTMLMRSPTQWVALVNVGSDEIITWDPINGMPIWGPAPTNGINELTGDVLAGPGTGSQAATLADSGVTPGSYTSSNITVDAKGRILSAADGTSASAIPSPFNSFFQVGQYYTRKLTQPPNITGLNASANSLYAVPIYIPEDTTFARIALNVGSGAVAGSSFDLGIYSNNNGNPSTLLADYGTVLTNTTGLKEINTTIDLDAGWWWLTLGGSATVAMVASANTDASLFELWGLPSPITAVTAGVTATWLYSAGNMPATFPTPTQKTAGIPLTWLRR